MSTARSASLLTLAAGCLLAASAWAQDVTANVETRGERVIVDVTARVAAPLADTWAVLIDYDHMASFVTSMKSSTVSQRQGHQMQVAQTGETKVGPFSFTVSSVRQIELTPMREIKSHLVSGDFKAFETLTRVSEDGHETVIIHHGEYIPLRWLPPMVGPSMIANETKKHYTSLIAEVLRRRAAGGEAPAVPGAPAKRASGE